MIKIDYNTALSALNNAVAKNGHDFVYEKGVFNSGGWEVDGGTPMCAYLHLDSEGDLTVPGCIVGHALLELGVPREFLADRNTGPTASDVSRSLGVFGIAEVTAKARSLLAWAQGDQDRGVPWGEAVVEAASYVNTHRWSDDESGYEVD